MSKSTRKRKNTKARRLKSTGRKENIKEVEREASPQTPIQVRRRRLPPRRHTPRARAHTPSNLWARSKILANCSSRVELRFILKLRP